MNRTLTVEADPSIRRTLARAGHNLTEWTDQQLTAVEFTARAIREGEHVFVSANILPLVDSLLLKKSLDAQSA